jgi:hypothetical protein
MLLLFLLTIVTAAAAVLTLVPLRPGEGPSVATLVAMGLALAGAVGLAMLLRSGGAEARRQFGQALTQIFVGLLCLGGVIAVAVF